MSRSVILVISLVLPLVLGGGVCLLLRQLQRQERLAARLRSMRHRGGIFGNDDQKLVADIGGLGGFVAGIGARIVRSGLLPAKTIKGLKRTLATTGVRGYGTLELFVGSKLLLLLLMPLLALAALHYVGLTLLMRNIGLAGAALIGLLGPDWWLARRYKKYLNAIVQGLPDALDLMVICAQAGLSFEPAISRVATEIRHAHPAISEEFGRTASEMRVAADNRAALTSMGARTGLESVKRMTSMLVQTMQYGTPLSDALRVLSAEMREEMMIRFETRAARLPVLLTIPMILFILPCIFLIVGGPAVIQVTKSFHH